MGSNAIGQIATVFTAIVGVAILAVLVSKNSQTPKVIDSAFKGFAGAVSAATGPVMGGSGAFNSFSSPQFG